MKEMRGSAWRWASGAGLVVALFVSAATGRGNAAEPSVRERVSHAVAEIQRADYAGDRVALARLQAELAPFVDSGEIASRVRYWRGFALWRRAINGFNEPADPKELAQDLRQATDEFDEAVRLDPGFGEAKIGALSCVSLSGFLSRNDPARLQASMAEVQRRGKAAAAAAPGNPRLVWVQGQNLWHVPAERGGGQARVVAMYEEALRSIRAQETAPRDSLEPSWGEPELLMSLAWSNLNRTTPDLSAAERQAQAALALVPTWHYVRDVLLPQIREAKKKTR